MDETAQRQENPQVQPQEQGAQEAGAARSRRRRGRLIGCLVPILLVVGAWAGFRAYWGHKVRGQLDAIRAQGLPVTLEDLNAWYPTPAGRNAADVYLDAAAALVQPEKGEIDLLPLVGNANPPARGEPMPAEVLAAARALLGKNRQVLGMLHEAAGIEECRYPVDLRHEVPTALLRRLQGLRDAARLLALQARALRQEGDTAGAVGAVADMLALARSLEKEPFLLSQLVRIAIMQMAIRAAEQNVSIAQPPDGQIAALDDALRAAEAPDGTWRGFVGERCIGSAVFQGKGFGAELEWPFLFRALRWTGVRGADHSAHLRLMSEAMDASREPLPERIRRGRDLEAEFGRLPFFCLLTKMLLPATERTISEDCKLLTRVRAARVGMAVERYRLAHGTLPETLADLVPDYLAETPLDPYDGKPLRYKKLEKGYVVYSIGPNDTDDGGDESSDVTFIVAR